MKQKYKVCYQQEAESRTRGKGMKSEPVRIKPQWESRTFTCHRSDMTDLIRLQCNEEDGHWKHGALIIWLLIIDYWLFDPGLLLLVSHLFSCTRQDQTWKKGCDQCLFQNCLAAWGRKWNWKVHSLLKWTTTNLMQCWMYLDF